MQQDILVNYSPQETRVALVEDGVVQELHVERKLERGLLGNVYLGRVARVLPGLQSAFVDIGLERAAFLHVADVRDSAPQHQDSATALRPIEKRIYEGQTLLVQVVRDPIGAKGARLSMHIGIAGRLMVLMPYACHVSVSQKIASPRRDALKQRVMQLLQTDSHGMAAACGYIVRTNAEEADDAALQEDMRYLQRMWARIAQGMQQQGAPALLYEDLRLAQRVLRDLADAHTNSIRVDSRQQHAQLLSFAHEYTPTLAHKVQHYHAERPIFDLYGVEEEIARALARRVELKSGGYLVFDQTEALASIDVNTGGFVGARRLEDTIFKTNLEAAHAIARQLRLRNLGGIIVVDFIDMENPQHRQEVLAELQGQLRRDRIKTSTSEDFSRLGLLEMTRKRTRESLAQMLCTPCPACQGRGSVKTARSVAYNILREVVRESRQFSPREFRILAAPRVIELLGEEESQHLAALGSFIGKPVSLQADPTLAPEQYDIVLM